MGTTTVEIASSSRLRELAGFRAVQGLALSVYVGFDPLHPDTEAEAGMRIASALAQARREAEAAGEGRDRAARLAVEEELERIRVQLEEGLGPESMACFAATPDGVSWSTSVATLLPDVGSAGDTFRLVPLVRAAGAECDVLVATVGRERGEISRLRAGRIERLADRSTKQPRRHRDGWAWELPRQLRRIDELTNKHLRETAAALEEALRGSPEACVVLAGSQENAVALRGLLSKRAHGAVAGIVHPDAHGDDGDLARLVAPVVERWKEQAEEALVERWLQAAGNGRAVQGWRDTLVAASEGRIELLLFGPSTAASAFECPACGRAGAVVGTCPLDGTPLERRPDALDLAVRHTLAHGGRVRALRTLPDPGPADGIGALLTF